MRLLAILLTIVSLVGCAAPNPNAGAPASQADAAKLTTVIASADLAVGANHFALALLDASNQPLAGLPVYLGFYELSGPEPVQLGLTEAVWRQPRGEWNRGVYKADVTFDRAGPHGVEATVVRADGERVVSRARFDVRAQAAAPALGAAAPRSRNLTNRDQVAPIELCTGSAETCAATAPLRELTIAEAIEQQKPLVVVFATPGFCSSQTCGPQLEIVQDVARRFEASANFVHVEIFRDPVARTPNATVQEWTLPSEPWVFVVDRDGRIADRFDGITTAEEIEGALRRLNS